MRWGRRRRLGPYIPGRDLRLSVQLDDPVGAGGEFCIVALYALRGSEREAGDAVGRDDEVRTGSSSRSRNISCQLPVMAAGSTRQPGGGMESALPCFEGGLADAGDDFVLGTVLVRAVVDLAQEEFGLEIRRLSVRSEDGVGGLLAFV